MKLRSATFLSEGEETKARIVIDTNGFSFSLMSDRAEDAMIVQQANFKPLVMMEAFQFFADVTAEEVSGRLSPFVRGWIGTASDAHAMAKEKGFWEENVERNNGELLCLIHSEISEALEALRKGNKPDDKLPQFSGVEVELADAVIRIMDLAHARGWDVARAVEAKMRYNAGRAHKHGKEF